MNLIHSITELKDQLDTFDVNTASGEEARDLVQAIERLRYSLKTVDFKLGLRIAILPESKERALATLRSWLEETK